MKTAVLLLCVVVLASSTATTRSQSALDGFDPNANNLILAAVVQPDGKILLGGGFSTLSPNGGAAVARNGIARLNPDGTLDTAFDPNANGNVNAIALQADGKIVIGGFFTTLSPNGGAAVTRNRIARLNSNGTLDTSFDPNASGAVRSLAVQADGKILVGGQFVGANSIGGAPRNRMARLDPVTGLADSFDPNANNTVFAIVVQADGKILAGGNFNGANSIGGQMRNRIARLDPTTGLADSFDPNANSGVFAIAVQPDGKILAGGAFNGANSIGGQPRNRIARLDPSTGLADGFNPNANFQVSAIVVQPDGKILVGGDFNGATGIGGAARNNIARLDPVSGAADSFDPKASNQASVFAIALQQDGKVVVGGNFTTIAANGAAAVTRNNIVRLEADGRLDRTLNLGIVGTQVRTIAVQPDGKILIGGIFSQVLGVTRNRIARLNSDGTLDMAFNPDATGTFGVMAIALQADGKIIVGGDFHGFGITIGGQSRDYIARLDPVTGAADTWNPRANEQVSALLVQPDGKILVAGSFSGFSSIGGANRNGIARLDPTTGQADSFNPNANSSVLTMALQADGKVLAAGRFTEIGGQPRNLFARLDGTTGLADSFDPNPNDLLLALAVQGDGKIVVVGGFNTIGGASRKGVARLDPITGLADAFDPNIPGQINAMALQSDGKILVAGSFTAVGTTNRGGLARLDPTTGAADSFDPDPDEAIALAVQADGKILAGGFFNQIGGQSRNLFARLSNDTAAQSDLVVTQNSATWVRGGSSTQFSRVRFESSSDNISYSPLGEGTRSGSNWNLSGLNLPIGANTYVRARGYYGTGNDVSSESVQESVQQAFFTEAAPPPPGVVANVATRLPVGTGDNVLIEGFIVLGPNGSTKKIIVRALGPFLTQFGIPDALANPTLEIRDGSNTVVATNDDWRNTQVGGIITNDQEAEIEASNLAPTNDLESAIIADLAPGNYTAVVRGVNNTVGTGIVDAFDLSPASPARLANVATRGLIQPGDRLMIAGFIIQSGDVRAVVRAIGPSLSAFGITNALPDTTLQLRDLNGVIVRENDDWQSDQKAELEATGLQPGNTLEAALIATLPPGQYTAQVRGKPESTGIGVVEIYFLQ